MTQPASKLSAPHPILLSYLDTVGPEGAARFFETTSGWDAPILDDRSAPRYPRHQRLSPAETTVVDQHLARLGCIRYRG